MKFRAKDYMYMFVGFTLQHSGVISPDRFVDHSPVMTLAMRACFMLVALLRALFNSCHCVATTGSFIRRDVIGLTLARSLPRLLDTVPCVKLSDTSCLQI